MSIEINERYGQMLREHRHAIDCRGKLFIGMGLCYAGFIALLILAQSAAKSLSLMVTFIWACFTALLWVTDYRHRSAMRHSKRAGKAIEQDATAGIAEQQRFFSNMEEEALRGAAMDFFSGIMIIIIFITSFCLFICDGKLL
jgi:hypothetical protein